MFSSLGTLMADPLWGPLLCLPAMVWFALALLFFLATFGDFRKNGSYENAQMLRFGLLALVVSPLATPIVAVGAVVGFGYLLFTKTGWLWDNTLGVIWRAIWMKEPSNDGNREVDTYSI